jgi:hypothetical protein
MSPSTPGGSRHAHLPTGTTYGEDWATTTPALIRTTPRCGRQADRQADCAGKNPRPHPLLAAAAPPPPPVELTTLGLIAT